MDARQFAMLLYKAVATDKRFDEIESCLKVTNPGQGRWEFTAYPFEGKALVVSVVAADENTK